MRTSDERQGEGPYRAGPRLRIAGGGHTDGKKTEFVEKLVSVIERYAKSDVPRIAVSDGSATLLLDQADILRVYTELRKLMVCTVRVTFDALCSLKEKETSLKAAMGERPGRRIALFIGPEGGFEPEEVQSLVQKGARPVSLGPRILRTETAGMAMMAQILFELGE